MDNYLELGTRVTFLFEQGNEAILDNRPGWYSSKPGYKKTAYRDYFGITEEGEMRFKANYGDPSVDSKTIREQLQGRKLLQLIEVDGFVDELQYLEVGAVTIYRFKPSF